MNLCALGRYHDQVYFHFRHLEIEPLRSAVAPNLTSLENKILQMNIKKTLIDGCLSCILLLQLTAVLSVHALFVNWFSPWNKRFVQETHYCLWKNQDLEHPHAFRIPIVSISHACRLLVQKTPPCPRNSEKPYVVWYGMVWYGYFLERPMEETTPLTKPRSWL